MPQLAVAMNQRADFGLEISPDRLVGLVQQRVRIRRLDLTEMSCGRHRFPIKKITTARGAVQGDLIRAQNEAGKTVPRIGDAGHIPPGVGRVARVDPDRVAMHASQRFPGLFVAGCSAHVAQDQLIGGQRDRFTHVRR